MRKRIARIIRKLRWVMSGKPIVEIKDGLTVHQDGVMIGMFLSSGVLKTSGGTMSITLKNPIPMGALREAGIPRSRPTYCDLGKTSTDGRER